MARSIFGAAPDGRVYRSVVNHGAYLESFGPYTRKGDAKRVGTTHSGNGRFPVKVQSAPVAWEDED